MKAKLNCWHQKADCSTEAYPGLSASEAVAKFRSIEWPGFSKASDDEEVEEGCVPGFGVYLADGSKLDLRSNGRTMACDFHYEDRDSGARMLSAHKVAHSDAVSMAAAEKLIKTAYAGDRQAILAELGG
jgi:hypothetical protein